MLEGFRLERAGFAVTDCAGLVVESKNALRLLALTPQAVRQGLRVGMTASEARARVPEVTLVDHDPAAEVRDRDDLLRAFDAVSDRATFLWDDAVVFDLATVAHLFGGERKAAQRAVALAQDLGHAARAAVADDALAARALARWAVEDGAVNVVPPGRTAEALAPLPIESLDPEEPLKQGLRAIGIATVGQWAKLDAAAVAGRFPEALRRHRVACGQPGAWVHLADDGPDTEPLRSLAPLPGATTRQEIHFVLPGLLLELCERVAARDLAIVRLLVEFRLEARGDRGALRAVVGVRIGRPTQSPSRLDPLVRQRIAGVVLDAPVEEIAIEAVEVVPEQGWQPGLTDRKEATEPLPELLARLADQLGPHALFAARPNDRWRPEAAWRPEAFPPPRLWPEPPGVTEALTSDDPVAIQEAFEAPTVLPRPAMLLSDPQPIEVVEGQGRPLRVSLGGRSQPCHRVAGPERLVGEWWRADPLDRAYWTVEADGRSAWIFQERQRWFLHGWFD
ncbi:MAG: hypothetical protein AAGA48_16190 [Myxococcota bacterium]